MELRSSRSRSRTPFLQTRIEQEMVSEHQNHSEEVIVQHSYSTRNKSIKSNTSSLSDEVFSSPSKQKSERVVRKGRHKTSDYSSEEGENEISSSKVEGNGNARSHASTCTVLSNGEVKSPFQVYKEAGEYWNKYPKTDYTYSIHSKDRTELAPGLIALPNMSRRSLRRSVDSTSSQYNHKQQYYDDSTDYSKSSTKYSYNERLEPKSLFRDEADSSYQSVQTVSIFRRMYSSVTTVFTRIVTSIMTVLSMVYLSSTSSVLWIGRGYYKAVSKLLLLDTWLLQSSSGNRRWGPLIALLFLPLLLLTGWWLWSGLSHALQEALASTSEPRTSSHTSSQSSSSSYGSSESLYLEEQLSKIILSNHANSEERINVNDIVTQLLHSPEFESIIAKHVSDKTAIFDQQKNTVNALKSEVISVNKKIDNLAANVRLENANTNARFNMELNKCCRRQFIHIESYVKRMLADLLGAPNSNMAPDDISKWLHTVFVAKQDLETRLSDLTQNVNSNFESLIDVSAAKIMNEVTERINIKLRERLEVNSHSYGVDSALSDSQVQRIVKQALAVYDADKTGLVDYALESSGGQVLSTRCTESYNARTAVLSILGVPLWYPSNTPRVVITPGVTPGECWAFQNFPGFLVIQLTATVKVSAFSLEHIPKSLAPAGRRDSAPKNFTVWGLQSENDRDPWQLGNYTYDLEGPSLQFFAVENEGPAFNMIELRIESNHGNANYTCLYRFRVHGMLSDEPT